MKSAWADIERFKEQKNHDLKEALISYAVMQISMCKKVSFSVKFFQQGTKCVSATCELGYRSLYVVF